MDEQCRAVVGWIGGPGAGFVFCLFVSGETQSSGGLGRRMPLAFTCPANRIISHIHGKCKNLSTVYKTRPACSTLALCGYPLGTSMAAGPQGTGHVTAPRIASAVRESIYGHCWMMLPCMDWLNAGTMHLIMVTARWRFSA